MLPKNNTPNVVCKHCGTPFYKKPSVAKTAKYCSVACANRDKRTLREVHVVGDGTAIIPLTKGLTAIIDEADVGIVSPYNWHASKSANAFYARSSLSSDIAGMQLHRFLLSPPSGLQVDHVNGDTLDNRRCNLRVVTASGNMKSWALRYFGRNDSGYRGVFPTTSGKWCARLYRDGRLLYLGSYETPESAAKAVEKESAKWEPA